MTNEEEEEEEDALKCNELGYHKQVAFCIIGYNSITVCPDEYDSRHNGIDFQHSHLCTLPVISAIFVCILHVRTYAYPQIRILP